MFTLPIDEELELTEIRRSDAPLYVEYFRDQEIYANTLRIPSPYTEKDAEEFFDRVDAKTREYGYPINFAIRRKKDALLLGGMGFVEFVPSHHAVEIGYWLAKPFRGNGIMTRAVKVFCEDAHHRFGIVRFTAGVFSHNQKSVRVVEKAGFEFEGLRRKIYRKDGVYIDSLLYAKVY